jgi:integrase/recombinase XerD
VPDPVQDVPPPRFEVAPVEAILKASEYCKESKTKDRRKFTVHRATGNRDCAIILTLLDTGLRSTELCSLKIGDVDMKTGRVNVRHGTPGGAKGGKGHAVFLGKSARRAVWRYLAEREDGEDPEAPLFVTKFNRPLNKAELRHRVITADAACMRRGGCGLIRQQQGHYLIVLKDNQPDVAQTVHDWFEPFPPSR